MTRRLHRDMVRLAVMSVVALLVLGACGPGTAPPAPAAKPAEAARPAEAAKPAESKPAAPAATTAPAAAAKPAEAAKPAASTGATPSGTITLAVEAQATTLDPQNWAGGSIDTFYTPSVYDSLV